MSRADQVERMLEREEERLSEELASGSISRDEYNKALRELQRDASEAYQQDREEALDRVRDEWGGW